MCILFEQASHNWWIYSYSGQYKKEWALSVLMYKMLMGIRVFSFCASFPVSLLKPFFWLLDFCELLKSLLQPFLLFILVLQNFWEFQKYRLISYCFFNFLLKIVVLLYSQVKLFPILVYQLSISIWNCLNCPQHNAVLKKCITPDTNHRFNSRMKPIQTLLGGLVADHLFHQDWTFVFLLLIITFLKVKR